MSITATLWFIGKFLTILDSRYCIWYSISCYTTH